MGVPAVGTTLKLVPVGDLYEMRVRGPHVTPGYWRQPALTAAAFDEEGFYRIGDALRFADPDDAGAGLLFAGRITEDFKLATGTWVHVGPLRAQVLDHFAPLLRDVVIAGPDRDYLTALLFPNLDACRDFGGFADDAPVEDVCGAGHVVQECGARLRSLAQTSTGASNRIVRAAIMGDPPSAEDGEITGKGSVNQRAVLRRRERVVEELYATPRMAHVLAIQGAE